MAFSSIVPTCPTSDRADPGMHSRRLCVIGNYGNSHRHHRTSKPMPCGNTTPETGLFRHIAACNNVVLPDGLLQFTFDGRQIGWIEPGMADRAKLPIADHQAGVADQAELTALTERLAREGRVRLRDEIFDVRAEFDGPVLAQIDRGAIPTLGLRAQGSHLNGLVRRADGLHIWVGRRAELKRVAPGKLDHLAAGGIPSGFNPCTALAKEAAEEAGIPAALIQAATEVGRVSYTMQRPGGLCRDLIHVFDLILPEDFVPYPADGEMAHFELWPASRVLETVEAGDDFKFNVNLVLIDLFLRHGLIAPGPQADRLRRDLRGH